MGVGSWQAEKGVRVSEDQLKGIEQFDAEERWRCPMLGGPVHFGYCRKLNEGLPCARILECWLQKLPLVEFLKTNYSVEEIQRVFSAKKKGRIERMVETVEETRGGDPPATDESGS